MAGPAVRWLDVPDAEPESSAADSAEEALNPATWDELHTRALAYTGDPTVEHQWLADFAQRVPTRGCVCRSDWARWARQHPADLSSTDTYFAWTVEAHNAVNVRLGKPQMSLEAARERWGQSP